MQARTHVARLATACVLLAGSASVCVAQLNQITVPEQHGPLRSVSRAEFAQNVARLQSFVEACKSDAGTCNVDVGPDENVAAEGPAPAFIERWDWLREALKDGAKEKTEVRSSAMERAAARLDELLTEADASSDGDATARKREAFLRAQKESAGVLARSEFQNVRQPNWWDRLKAMLFDWLGRILMGVGEFGASAPWLVTLMEWLFFIGAGAGLLLFVWRNFARQRMQVAISSGALQTNAWDREATDWAAEAEAHAAQHAWREAVHCLYWAAIVRLESRRAWQHDPSRTPREYVRLLKAGTTQHNALLGLTGLLERVWYGLRDAEALDYERARGFFTGLGQNATDSGR